LGSEGEGRVRIRIAAALAEQLARVRELVIDLQQIPVQIVKVDALLAHMIHRPDDRHAVGLERHVGLLEGLLAVDEKRDVPYAHRAQCLSGGHPGIVDRKEVDGMAQSLEGHEDAPMLWTLLHDLEAEQRRIEGSGGTPSTPQELIAQTSWVSGCLRWSPLIVASGLTPREERV